MEIKLFLKKRTVVWSFWHDGKPAHAVVAPASQQLLETMKQSSFKNPDYGDDFFLEV